MTYYTGRRDFYMTEWEIPNFGYGGGLVDRYRAIRNNIYAEEPISSDTIEYLRSMGRDIYVVLWAEDVAPRPDLESRFSSRPDWFRPVFGNGAGAVYLVTKG